MRLQLWLSVTAFLLTLASADGAGANGSSIVFKRNFEPKGAWADHGEEASPVFLNGKLYLVQSIMGRFPADGSQGAHSGFCVYDARTGRTVSCPDSSSA